MLSRGAACQLWGYHPQLRHPTCLSQHCRQTWLCHLPQRTDPRLTRHPICLFLRHRLARLFLNHLPELCLPHRQTCHCLQRRLQASLLRRMFLHKLFDSFQDLLLVLLLFIWVAFCIGDGWNHGGNIQAKCAPLFMSLCHFRLSDQSVFPHDTISVYQLFRFIFDVFPNTLNSLYSVFWKLWSFVYPFGFVPHSSSVFLCVQ